LEEVLKHVIIFLYIISFLMGISGITLAVLLAEKHEDKLYKWVRAFVLAFFLYEVTNFIVFYRAFFTSHWEVNIIIMIFSDICLLALLYTWIGLIGKVASMEGRNKLFDKSFEIFSVIYVLGGIFINLYGIEKDYNLTIWGKVLSFGMNSILSLFAIAGSTFYLVKGLKMADQMTKKILLILIVAMYLFIFLFFSEDLYMNFDFQIFNSFDIYAIEPIAALYLLLNVLFIIYVFKEELLINAIESDGAFEPDRAGGVRQSIEDISTQYCLTDREKEVLAIVYEGHSNLEIAEMLCISPFTVKRHINNIFRKMAVKTRVELMHLVITAK